MTIPAAFDAKVHYALIASPSDTDPYRDVVERAIWQWNGGSRAKSTGVVFLPRRWENDAVPVMNGEDGQTVINDQLVRSAAVVFVIFHTRLGGRTPRADSGTVEELQGVAGAGGLVHVYFSHGLVDPESIDYEQQAALDRFKNKFPGLYVEFSTSDQLGTKVRDALDQDAEKCAASSVASSAPGAPLGARLRVRVELGDSPRLIVVNEGTAAAEGVSLELEPLGPYGGAPMLVGDVDPTIEPGEDYSFTLFVFGQSSKECKVMLTWTEAGELKTRTQDVNLA